ncbi:hypothetical protein ABE354_02995 [Brevibacillus laterosporus]|uniref:hypothetical protein n=1 Tax=Brevibacillus laterosporus TaxID=1465 RepID=UPI003D1B43D7
MSLNKEYKQRQVDVEFWRDIGVSADQILELDEHMLDAKISDIFAKLNKKDANDLGRLLGNEATEDYLLTNLMQVAENEKRSLLLLKEFLNRKKRQVETFYVDYFQESEGYYKSSSLIKIIHLFKTSPITLVEIYSWYLWENRTSGNFFTVKNKISFDQAKKISTDGNYSKALIDKLYIEAGSKKEFRVFSHGTFNNEKIVFVIYKKVNDTPRADFGRAVRNKEVINILFMVDSKENTIEIKANNLEEKKV